MDRGTASALVQVVDVLRDQRQAMPTLLQTMRGFDQGQVRGVGVHLSKLRAPFLVEAPHQLRIARPRFGRRDIFGPLAFP